jgi:hypothetical protein
MTNVSIRDPRNKGSEMVTLAERSDGPLVAQDEQERAALQAHLHAG